MIAILRKIKQFLNKLSSYFRKVKIKRKRDLELENQFEDARSVPKIKQEIQNFNSNYNHLAQVKKFNREYLGGYRDTKWNMFYCIISDNYSEKYIPEDVFVNHIEPRLNNLSHAQAFEEKNNYDNLFVDLNRPRTLIRYIKGSYLNNDYEPISFNEAREILIDGPPTFLLKPALNSGMGRGIKRYQTEDVSQLFDFFKQQDQKTCSFIVQEWIKQHPDLSKVFPGSVNTLKIITLRVNSEIIHLMTRFNVGRGKTPTDKNGYFVGVKNDGAVKEDAFDKKNFERQKSHEETGVSFVEIKIPSFERATEMCQNAHRRLLHFDMVSWDVAIDQEGEPVLVEFNIRSQGIDNMQLACGPLFGKYTEEILSEYNLNLYFNI